MPVAESAKSCSKGGSGTSKTLKNRSTTSFKASKQPIAGVFITRVAINAIANAGVSGSGGITVHGEAGSNVLAAYDVKTNNSRHSVKNNDLGRLLSTLSQAPTLALTPSHKATDTSSTDIDSTRTALLPTLDGGAGGVHITTGAAGVVNIEAPIIKGNGYTYGGGTQTNFIAAIDSREVSHTVTRRNTLWQSSTSVGSLNQTLHMTRIQVPVGMTNFVGSGGISVQLPKGAALPQQIATLAKQPGNEYLTDLAKRSDIDWKQVEVINKSWDYKKQGLTQEAAIIVAIVVTIVTWGAASSAGAAMATAAGETVAVAATATTAAVAGSTAGAVIAGATAAGITTLASQAAIALINNQGDVGAAAKELGSKENVKALATAMVTAGLVQGLGVAFNLPTGAGTSTTLLGKLQTNLINGVAGSLVSTAINGGSLEDNLKNAIKTAIISSVAAQGAGIIGDLKLDKFSSNLAHAILGCAVGSATADSSSGCAAGAGGAVVGHLSAEWYGDKIGIKDLTGDALAQAKVDVASFAKLTTAIAGLAGGANAMTIAGVTSNNAVTNNYLSHVEIKDREIALKDCRAKNDPSCEVKELQKYDAISAKNTAEINYNSVLEKGSLEEVKKGLDILLKDPAVSAESKQQAIKSLNEITVALNVIARVRHFEPRNHLNFQ